MAHCLTVSARPAGSRFGFSYAMLQPYLSESGAPLPTVSFVSYAAMRIYLSLVHF
jgi:hypothetical protein